MKRHIVAVGVLHIGLGILGILAATIAALGVIVPGLWAFLVEGDLRPPSLLALVTCGVGLFLGALAVPGIIGGIGLLRYRPWARRLVTMLVVLELFLFPIGTVVGLYALWVLRQKRTVGLFIPIANRVEKLVRHGQGAEIDHPGGLHLAIVPGVFDDDSVIEIATDPWVRLGHVGRAFRVSSMVASDKVVSVSIRLDYEPGGASPHEDPVPFVEIEESGETYLVAGTLQEHTVNGSTQYCMMVRYALFRNRGGVIGGGIIVPPAVLPEEPVFHPVQHQFKIPEDEMQRFVEPVDGSTCRRRDADGEPVCDQNPFAPGLYPACYPAAWACLCSAYRLMPTEPCRRWNWRPDGTTPPPNDFGDYFSTWTMGSRDEGDISFETAENPLPVARVADWQVAPDPPPALITRLHFVFEGDPKVFTEAKVRGRAALIKHHLLQVVGGAAARGLPSVMPARPVMIRHSGHAWVVVGVGKEAYWSHAQMPTASSFSDRCTWENAAWLKGPLDTLRHSGSGGGVERVGTGKAGIGNASRAVTESEKLEYNRATVELVEHIIAHDGIAIVVNSELAVDDLGEEQVRDIFAGAITNWREVGGPDADIVVVSRAEGSGTRDEFEKQVMGGYAISGNAVLPFSNDGVGYAVGATPNAIGYLSLGLLLTYAEGPVKAVAIDSKPAAVDSVPNPAYPFYRPFNMITRENSDNPNELAQVFLDYALSEDGQAEVENANYVPVGGGTTEPPAGELSGSLKLAGSTSVHPLADELAKAFVDRHPDVTIEVKGTVQKLSDYWTAYPDNCELKPEDRRLGGIAFRGSADDFKRVRFVDVDYPSIHAVDHRPVDTINWTPHTGAHDPADPELDHPGYQWIEGNVYLDAYGRPLELHDDHWDPVLGRKIPRPTYDWGNCDRCGSETDDGCGRCRLRLKFPFWVHNTTLDKYSVSYRMNLHFWTKDREWANINDKVKPIQLLVDDQGKERCDEFAPEALEYDWPVPGPEPGMPFAIRVREDPWPNQCGRPWGPNEYESWDTWNSQPIGWYVDFHKAELVPGEVHGIKLVLTCIETQARFNTLPQPVSLVQDVKQLWFRMTSELVY